MARQLGNFVHDLRLPKDFHSELRFKRMRRKHGSDGMMAVLMLWSWAASNCPTTGRLEKMTVEDILDVGCIATECTGFIDDLVDYEFLVLDGNTYCLSNWEEEQPHAAQAEERSRVARLKAEKSWENRRKRGVESEQSTGKATAKQGQRSNTNSNTNLKSPPTPPRGGQIQSAPVSEIVALYRKALPELPEPREETEKLGKDIGARWQAKPERQSLEWWAWFFGLVRECPYLLGEGKDGWRASLGWLVAKGNMDKVLGGEYPVRGQAGGGGPQPVKSYTLEESERMRLAAEAAEAEAPPG